MASCHGFHSRESGLGIFSNFIIFECQNLSIAHSTFASVATGGFAASHHPSTPVRECGSGEKDVVEEKKKNGRE